MPDSSEPFLYQGQVNGRPALLNRYVNQKLEDIQPPAAVIDKAVVKRNCKLMLEAADQLKVQFRAHVKTHKTLEVAKLQVGDQGSIRLVVSTIAELELLLPWLQENIKQSRFVNVLYGVPISPSNISRLAEIAQSLGSSQYISVLVDHPETLNFISKSRSLWPDPVHVFLKIDTGYHRAGVLPQSNQLRAICSKLQNLSVGHVVSVLGLYSHLGHSYSFSIPEESVKGLLTEFETLVSVVEEHSDVLPSGIHLSVGATPTATAAQTLASPDTATFAAPVPGSILYRWNALKNSGHILELHAGVYPFLDLQQLATHARILNLDYKDIGLRILAEVASLYPERSPPEALIGAGSLALGREPCKSYSGWGIVSPWRSADRSFETHYSESLKTGWIVGRISQEHGILSWQGKLDGHSDLKIGEKLLIWPNHACIAGAGFGWYLVVDSESDNGNVVRDVWVRCRGW